MKIIVTGGSGYLGTHLCRYFQAADFSRRRNLDIASPEDTQLLAEYDVVIHLAAFMDRDPDVADECFRINAEATANVLRSLREGSIFIYASTKDVYGANADRFRLVDEDCPTTYAEHTAFEWSKLLGEKYVEFYAAQRSLRAAIFRLSTTYAPPSVNNEPNFVGHYVESLQHGSPLRLPANGHPIRDLLHVDDFARACQNFIDSDVVFGTYNVGGGAANAVSLSDLVARIANLVHAEPVWEVVAEEANLESNSKYAQFSASDSDEARAAFPSESSDSYPVPLHYISDLTKIRRELAWQPTIGIDEGLQTLV